MAGMDLSFRRADRGISVFWMILAMGAGVFGLLAILIIGTEAPSVDEGSEVAESVGGGEILVNDGETVVVGQGNTSAGSDDTATTFSGDETTVVDGPTEEGDLSVEDVEVPVEQVVPAPGADEAQGGTDADAGAQEATAAEPVEGAESSIPGAGDVVVDPDGTTAPVVPTPVGPEGGDDNPLSPD